MAASVPANGMIIWLVISLLGELGLIGLYVYCYRVVRAEQGTPQAETKMPLKELQEHLIANFGLTCLGGTNWQYEGPAVQDTQTSTAEACLALLRLFQKQRPFSQVCVLAGPPRLIVCGTKPQPHCLVSSLDVANIGRLVASITKSGNIVVEFEGGWLLNLPETE